MQRSLCPGQGLGEKRPRLADTVQFLKSRPVPWEIRPANEIPNYRTLTQNNLLPKFHLYDHMILVIETKVFKI